MKNETAKAVRENPNSGAALGWLYAAALPVIIIASMLLTALARLIYPALFFLVWKLRTKNRKYALCAWKLLVVPGVFLGVFGICTAILEVLQKKQFVFDIIVGLVLLLGGGVAMVILGTYSRNQSKRFKKYINAIVNEKITSIEVLSGGVSITVEIVEKELQQMMVIGFFPGAMLDREVHAITLPCEESESNVNNTISCKNCGANTRVAKGVACDCNNCGVPLKNW